MTAWFLLFWQGVQLPKPSHAVEKAVVRARYKQYQIGRGTMTQKVAKHG